MGLTTPKELENPLNKLSKILSVRSKNIYERIDPHANLELE